MKKLTESQLTQWADIVVLLGNLVRAKLIKNPKAIASATDALRSAGWLVSIEQREVKP